jgi:hypothetical protein
VINAIWSGEEWNNRWQPIKSFRVRYDDGFHQVAEIMLDWYGSAIEMKVIRFRTQPLCTEFFCPRPPSPLVYQSGKWLVENEDRKKILVASRRIELAEDPEESERQREFRLTSYAEKLSGRLSLILSSFDSVFLD